MIAVRPLLLALAAVASLCGCAQAQTHPPALAVERTIALANVRGRIDHLAFDLHRRLLAIAELENGSVDIVDLSAGAVAHRISGLGEPQGLAFDRGGALLIVADRADGAVHFFNTRDFAPVGALRLGADADNVRIDPRNGRAIVGFGDGALAIIDVDARALVARIALPAHPESFQIDSDTGLAFVNLPDRHAIAAVALDTGGVTPWALPSMFYNFPLALDPASTHLASVFRLPARLALFDRNTGALLASAPTCGDSDDAFFDARRHRIYVACGAGAVDVFDSQDATLAHVGRVGTASGARTALFVPELDRLFVAVRARADAQASILELRPVAGDVRD
ncbi:MAG: hypothetical protein JSS00_05325 [Proteobacteria bacterium]|nr:hypothetical protein [Pseudomonadota bacterium]